MREKSLIEQRLTANVNLMLRDFETVLELLIEENILTNLSNHSQIFNEKEIRDQKVLNAIEKSPDDFRALLKEKTFVSKVQLINKHLSKLETNDQFFWKDAQLAISTASEVRSDAYHNREITNDHLDSLVRLFQQLIKTKSESFQLLEVSLDEVIHMPISADFDDGDILCNFPDPDYILHRFIGRSELFKAIKKELLISSWPVICLYGPGGYGKSAFVDHICRFLASEGTFEKIIWFSDKRERFDLDHARPILIEQTKTFVEFQNQPINDNSMSLTEILECHRTLIVIDNLETFFDDGIEFIEKFATAKSQFLITSRIEAGIGKPFKIRTSTYLATTVPRSKIYVFFQCPCIESLQKEH